jgi:hypothetical protein
MVKLSIEDVGVTLTVTRNRISYAAARIVLIFRACSATQIGVGGLELQFTGLNALGN